MCPICGRRRMDRAAKQEHAPAERGEEVSVTVDLDRCEQHPVEQVEGERNQSEQAIAHPIPAIPTSFRGEAQAEGLGAERISSTLHPNETEGRGVEPGGGGGCGALRPRHRLRRLLACAPRRLARRRIPPEGLVESEIDEPPDDAEALCAIGEHRHSDPVIERDQKLGADPGIGGLDEGEPSGAGHDALTQGEAEAGGGAEGKTGVVRLEDALAPGKRRIGRGESGEQPGQVAGAGGQPEGGQIARKQGRLRPSAAVGGDGALGRERPDRGEGQRRGDALCQQPGERLAARALERASGKPFTRLLAKRIAAPLSLASIGPLTPEGTVTAHRRGRPQASLLPRDLAAFGLAASARDLARLLAALTAPDSPLPGRERIFEPHHARLSFGAAAGLGLTLSESVVPGTGRLAFVESAYPGVRAQLLIALDHRVAVAVLANGAESFRIVGRLVDLALDQALGRDPAAREAARRAREQPPESMPWPERATPSSPARLYATPFGLIRVEGGGDSFRAEAFGLRFAAERRGDGWYRVRYRLLGLVPLAFDLLDRVLLAPVEIDGDAYLLAALGGRVFLLGSAVHAPPTADGAHALLGRWQVTSSDPLLEQFEIREARLTLENDLLTLTYEIPFFLLRLRPRILLAAEDGALRVVGTGPGLGERIRIGEDREGIYLEYSGFRLRRVL